MVFSVFFVHEMSSTSSSSFSESSSSSDFSPPSSPVLKVKSTGNIQVRVRLGPHVASSSTDKENQQPIDERLKSLSVKWKPKTHIGRLVKRGVIVNFMTLLAAKKPIKEPEIIDWLFRKELRTAVLKVSSIGRGQYRFIVYAAVGDGAGYVGIGSSCGRTEATTTERAVKNAKLCLHRVQRKISKPIEGQFANCWVKMEECNEVVAEPMLKKIMTVAGITGVRVTTNATRPNWSLVEAVKDALQKLSLI